MASKEYQTTNRTLRNAVSAAANAPRVWTTLQRVQRKALLGPSRPDQSQPFHPISRASLRRALLLTLRGKCTAKQIKERADILAQLGDNAEWTANILMMALLTRPVADACDERPIPRREGESAFLDERQEESDQMWAARAEAVEVNNPAADEVLDFLYQGGVTSWCEVVGVAREFENDFCEVEDIQLIDFQN